MAWLRDNLDNHDNIANLLICERDISEHGVKDENLIGWINVLVELIWNHENKVIADPIASTDSLTAGQIDAIDFISHASWKCMVVTKEMRTYIYIIGHYNP